MKRLVNITSRLFVAYFLSLPALYGSHSLLHEHTPKAGGDVEGSHFSSECTACDLFENQSGTLESAEFTYKELNVVTGEFFFAVELYCAVPEFVSLRGPPQV